MNTNTVIAAIIIVFFQITFLVVLFRNIIKRKSLVGWLFPGGTTKAEKALLIFSILIILSVIIFWP
jgi:hypothetical protein